MFKLHKVLFMPFIKFLQLQAASSILLLVATLVALAWANSPFAASYESLWHTPLTIGFGSLVFKESLHFWINDGLMALFFLVVGLEIKRELLVGELSSPRQAALPIFAAIGGMLVPALLYMLLNPPGSEFFRGWGIPTVTDIAFAIGVLTVLGTRAPLGLKVFLTALAIVDDLGAILLIALFYSGNLNLQYLVLAALVLGLMLVLNRSKIDRPAPYLILGLVLWVAILKSGLHATIAGVLLALMIPAKGTINPVGFYQEGHSILERFREAGISKDNSLILTNHEHQASVQALEDLCEAVQAPLQQVEHALHPWVSFLILPLFALANAGVSIPTGNLGASLLHPITVGIIVGLFLGKQLGITLFSWLAIRLKWAVLPLGVTSRQIYGVSFLGGIGFTMSLFISVLAFEQQQFVSDAKIGILLASLLSALAGIFILWMTSGPQNQQGNELSPVDS